MSKSKKPKNQPKQSVFKSAYISWGIISVLVVALGLFIAWLFTHETKKFSLQPLKTSTIYALPIEPSSDQSHEESIDITGKLSGYLSLQNPAVGSFDVVLKGLNFKEVIIAKMINDEESDVTILNRKPFDINSELSAAVETALVEMGTYPISIDLHSLAPNFRFAYDANKYTRSDEYLPTLGGLDFSLESGKSTIKITGSTRASLTMNNGEILHDYYIIDLFGVHQIKIGNEILETPDQISLVLVFKSFSDMFYGDNNFTISIDSNFTELRNAPADNNLIDIDVLAPVVMLENPSGFLTIGTEKRELSRDFDEVLIKAADEHLLASIKAKNEDYEVFIKGKSNNVIVNGEETINTHWQALSSELRGFLLGTVLASVLGYILKTIYELIQKEKVQ